MTMEECEIAGSVPRAAAPAPSTPPSGPPKPDAAAVSFVETAVNDPASPVVMFALAWCEFCWSVRKLFAAAGIPFRAIDLDAPDFSGGAEFAAQVRAALAWRTGAATIPKVFVGGVALGGASETLAAFDDGRLPRALAEHGIAAETDAVPSAAAFLPGWVSGSARLPR
jgi:cysteine synthase A